ncbi:hypothetical protein CFOL_v3_06693 [Cephalotus follicularis]|uniref:Synergin gamma C-terminal domain-containing protein n=1 Tax=Cephalotus follicularis TaxID=3775 RepID=A0A1Q3B5W0_CEPFO|nr:hypothetical protein CFOL_v3_06693 [Cephalotus follicularis]
MAEEYDDEGFGDFKYVTSPSLLPPNPTFHQHIINGPHSFNVEEDDDWGDFVNSSATLTRTDTFGFFTHRNNNNAHESDPTQPDSAPSRIHSNRWPKPKGALPLSIFGEAVADEDDDEDDEEEDDGAMSFSFSKYQNSGVVFNDLLANLYKQNQDSKPDNGSGSDFDVSKVDLGLNGNVSNMDKKEGNLSLNLDLDWNGFSSGTNGSRLDAKDGNLNMRGLDLDWNEFKSSRNVSNFDMDSNGNGDFVVNDDHDGWDFKVAESKTDAVKVKVENMEPALTEQLGYTSEFGRAVNGSSDLFSSSNGISQISGEWDFGFGVNPSSGINSVAYFTSKQNNMENGLKSSQVDGSVDDLKEDSWGFKDAFSDLGSKDKKNEEKSENHNGALPLSIFGDVEVETDDPMPYQDASTNKPASNLGDGNKSLLSNISINDLISNLYTQADQNASANHLKNQGHDRGASTDTAMDSNVGNGDNDLDDGTWEFRGAFSGTESEHQTSIIDFGDSLITYSTKRELNDYMDFYSKMKDELSIFAVCHLDNLKKARSNAALSGEDAKVKALDTEIQDLHNKLHDSGLFSKEVQSESCTPRNICLNELLEALKEPKFQLLESEYNLLKRFSFAEKDLKSAMELLEHATSTLKILALGSEEEQFNYVSTWFKLLTVCIQELKHGALIWKQSLEKNFHCQILSKPQGKQYIIALGEIYRVVEVLGLSAKLYKPWILSSADYKGLFALLRECSAIWTSSGLVEALHSVSDTTGLEYDGDLKALLESIECIQDLDAPAFHNYIVSGQEPKCQLSALPNKKVPGMKMVVWNGEHYFLTLVNLWSNLVSEDPPNLSRIKYGR